MGAFIPWRTPWSSHMTSETYSEFLDQQVNIEYRKLYSSILKNIGALETCLRFES